VSLVRVNVESSLKILINNNNKIRLQCFYFQLKKTCDYTDEEWSVLECVNNKKIYRKI
jgi:hypothetical protein